MNGFVPDNRWLPVERSDVARGRRERAALLVLAISRGYAPEELVDQPPPDVLEAFGDDLERDEGLAHVDLLLNVLAPRVEAGR
jgi:hypothetical protein